MNCRKIILEEFKILVKLRPHPNQGPKYLESWKGLRLHADIKLIVVKDTF